MKKSMGLVALLSALAMLAPTASHADSTTYVAAAAVSSTLTANGPAPVGKVSPLGGFQFNVTSTGKIRVTLADVAGTAVPYSVCQKIATEPGLCGDGAGDIDLGYHCNKGGVFSGLTPSKPVAVFVFSTGDPLDEDCAEALGTTGKLTVVSAA